MITDNGREADAAVTTLKHCHSNCIITTGQTGNTYSLYQM